MTFAELVSTILPHTLAVVTVAPPHPADLPDELLFEPGTVLALDTYYGPRAIVVESYTDHPVEGGELLVTVRQYGTQRRATWRASAIRNAVAEVL